MQEGYASAYQQYLDRPYASDYVQAEEEARREKRGLWRQGIRSRLGTFAAH